MEITVKSGSSGQVAKVDDNKRIHTQSLSEDEALHAAELGSAFNLNTGLISLGADATLCYVKNTDPDGRDLVLEQIIVGVSAGITYETIGFSYITLVDTPTAGDLITDADVTGVINKNRNSGKSNDLEGVFYKGKSGGTQSGGTNAGLFQLNATGRSAFPINWIVGKGKSAGLTLDINANSGSASFYVALVCYYKDLQSRD